MCNQVYIFWLINQRPLPRYYVWLMWSICDLISKIPHLSSWRHISNCLMLCWRHLSTALNHILRPKLRDNQPAVAWQSTRSCVTIFPLLRDDLPAVAWPATRSCVTSYPQLRDYLPAIVLPINHISWTCRSMRFDRHECAYVSNKCRRQEKNRRRERKIDVFIIGVWHQSKKANRLITITLVFVCYSQGLLTSRASYDVTHMLYDITIRHMTSHANHLLPPASWRPCSLYARTTYVCVIFAQSDKDRPINRVTNKLYYHDDITFWYHGDLTLISRFDIITWPRSFITHVIFMWSENKNYREVCFN